MNNNRYREVPGGEEPMLEEMTNTSMQKDGPGIMMDPGETLVAMYNAAINRVELAIANLGSDENALQENILKAKEIITNLSRALDYSYNEELCTNLEMIYFFMLGRLSSAGKDKNLDDLSIVLRHLSDMRDTWRQAVDAQHSEKSAIE
ncbi:MAG: flagellar protein FliS [Deltaproteobacteria bacterium]|nr:flagellar protein FliS [Deltaproteobacteria bacterium]